MSARRNSLRALSALAGGVLVGTGLLAFPPAASAHPAAPAAVTLSSAAQPSDPGEMKLLAVDEFTRSVPQGWGQALLGGSYSVFDSPASKLSVAGGKGVMSNLAPGTSAGVGLSPAVLNGQAQAVVTMPAVSMSSLGLVTSLELRRQTDGSAYRAKLHIAPGGISDLSVSRTTMSTETQIGANVAAPAVKPGQAVVLQARAIGTSPVTILVRTFTYGQATPDWQLSMQDAGPSRIAVSGAFGLWNYVSSRSVPSTLQFDILRAWSVSFPGSTPPASTGTPLTFRPRGALGSAVVGSAAYPVPSGALFVNPTLGSDGASGTVQSPVRTIARAIAMAAAGQTVVLRAGSYHESVVITKAITVQAYPREAAWFDGAVPVTNWSRVGSTWVSSGWTSRLDDSASFSFGVDEPRILDPAYPYAAKPDQVFVNGSQLGQVGTASQVTAGAFAVDQGAQQLIIGSDPTGRDMRASTLTQAIRVDVPGVVLRGFGVRSYAPPVPQMGAIRLNRGGTIENLYVRDAATLGISVSGAATIARTTVTGAGMIGIHGNEADGTTVRDSSVTLNNSQHFAPGIAAGGIKITRSRQLKVINDDFSRNYGSGLWLDESCVGITIVGNSAADNDDAGIKLELSDTGFLADNTVTGGYSGIYLFNSGNFRIYNNAVGGQSVRSLWLDQNERRQSDPSDEGHDPRAPIPDPTVPWLTRNVTIANNLIAAGPAERIRVLDRETNVSADQMNVNIVSNMFSRNGVLLAWGGPYNVIASSYSTVQQLQAKNSAWANLDSAGPTLADLAAVAGGSGTAAIPADIAAAVGVPAGTLRIGQITR